MEECLHPEPDGIYQYVGSTDSMTHRWAYTKSKVNAIAAGNNVKPGIGLEKHMKTCTQYSEPCGVTLLEQYNTTIELLQASSHQEGPGCRCSECNRLKQKEDKWISRMGSYHGKYGLNDMDEISRNTRVNY